MKCTLSHVRIGTFIFGQKHSDLDYAYDVMPIVEEPSKLWVFIDRPNQ